MAEGLGGSDHISLMEHRPWMKTTLDSRADKAAPSMAAQLEVDSCEITKLILQYFDESDLPKSFRAYANETQV